MKLLPLSSLIAAAMLSGCLDDSKDLSNTGALPVPNISGLTYETATQSGAVSASKFKYEDGETVSIKLGGQVLLTFDAAANIELEALLNEWPTTESELRDAYYNDDSFENFQNVANFMQLIHNLDADNDSENGFDLTAYQDIEITTDINLGDNLDEFYRLTLLTLAGEIGSTRSVTPMTSIGALFSLAEKNIEIQQLTEQSTDTDINETVDKVVTYDYSDLGFRLSDNTDNNLDTITDTTFANSYNEKGLLISDLYQTDSDFDGQLNREYGNSYSYNDLNLSSLESFSVDQNGDGTTNYSYKTENEYDASGLLITQDYFEDDNGDGVDDSRQYTTFTYNESRQLLTQTRNDDEDLDGVYNDIITHTYSYSDSGNLLQIIRIQDDGADNITDKTSIETYEYNHQNLETNKLIQYYDDEDVLGFNVLDINSYDELGNKTAYSSSADYDGDGDFENVFSSTLTNDENGNLIESVTLTYGDGVTLSKRVRYTHEYNDKNEPTSYKKEEDDDLDGTYDSTYIQTYTYNDSGDYLTRTSTSDDDNNGEIDSSSEITYAYTVKAEGVQALLREFEQYD